MHHFKKLTRYKVDAQKSVLFNITVTENMTMKIHFNFSKNFLERTIHFNKVESILGLNNGIISWKLLVSHIVISRLENNLYLVNSIDFYTLLWLSLMLVHYYRQTNKQTPRQSRNGKLHSQCNRNCLKLMVRSILEVVLDNRSPNGCSLGC